MSLIELMVGVAVGLIVLTAASRLFVANLRATRQLLTESRVNQDLRSTMDLIVRDLRRSGYWGNALKAGATDQRSLPPNPYLQDTDRGVAQVDYRYSRDIIENDMVDPATEQFGFRYNKTTQAIQMLVGGNWQTLTNTDLIRIPEAGFSVTPSSQSVDLRLFCSKPCTDSADSPACPRMTILTYNIQLKGVSRSDPTIERYLRSSLRLRNETVSGQCPL